MKKTTKAVLASAFIFPGVGHILLKRYSQSAVFISIASAAIVVIISHVVSVASEIADRVISGEVAPNLLVIRQLIIEQRSGSETLYVSIATWVLVAVWLISIADAYRVGKAQ